MEVVFFPVSMMDGGGKLSQGKLGVLEYCKDRKSAPFDHTRV